MTKSANSSFFKGFLFLFVVLSGLILLLEYIASDILYSKIWLIQIFFFFLTVLAHFISSKGLKDKKDFHMFYMASMGARLFCCIIFAITIIISASASENLVLFAANFFILYLVYTSFEIYFLLRNLRADL